MEVSQMEKDLERFNRALGDAEKWYRCRITELIRFRDAAQSTTTRETMNGACELTALAYKAWELVASEATALAVEFDRVCKGLSPPEVHKFVDEFADDFGKMNQAIADLTESLIYETYKPDYSQFHKDTAKGLVVAALKKIDMLSILDDIEALREIDPNYKLSKNLKSGDEVIAYVESYGEQVVEWACAARAVRISTNELKNELTRLDEKAERRESAVIDSAHEN